MRLFVGLPWPENARDHLAERVRVWEGRPALRLLPPENWHVTLRFLGDLPTDKVATLGAVVEGWSKNRGALTFVDRGWTCFGSYAAPRVVLLALEALPAVQKAVTTLHKSLDAASFAGDDKPWKPHVTVAYGKGGHPGPWPEERPGGRPPVLFTRAVLYESTLGPDGSTYREVVSVPLVPIPTP